MTVGFIFRNGEKRIVGGTEHNYPTNDLSWLKFNTGEIMIQTKKEDIFCKVKKKDVFPTISGAINIGLTLDAEAQLDVISVGDKVFKISN